MQSLPVPSLPLIFLNSPPFPHPTCNYSSALTFSHSPFLLSHFLSPSYSLLLLTPLSSYFHYYTYLSSTYLFSTHFLSTGFSSTHFSCSPSLSRFLLLSDFHLTSPTSTPLTSLYYCLFSSIPLLSLFSFLLLPLLSLSFTHHSFSLVISSHPTSSALTFSHSPSSPSLYSLTSPNQPTFLEFPTLHLPPPPLVLHSLPIHSLLLSYLPPSRLRFLLLSDFLLT